MTGYNDLPDFADLPRGSQAWARKVTEALSTNSTRVRQLDANINTLGKQQEGISNGMAEQGGQIGQVTDAITPILLPDSPPSAPSAPTLTSALGVVTITWDGEFEDGKPYPGLREVYAEMSTVAPTPPVGGVDPTPWERVGQGLVSAGDIMVSTTVGSQAWFRLRAVSNNSLYSDPSDAASIIVDGIGPVDFNEDFQIDSTMIADNAITQAKIAAGAVGQAEVADFAITVKKLNTNRHFIF